MAAAARLLLARTPSRSVGLPVGPVLEEIRGGEGRCRMTKDSATHATGLRRLLRRLAVGVSGSAIVVVGLILVPLPGPGWAIALAGVALLGTEFSWAERLLREVQRRLAPAAELLRHVPRPWRVAAAYAAAAGGMASMVLSLALLRL
jgi:uncharacterized protein (TIGR02611 family)